MISVFDCSLYELNKFHYPEGNLTYVYQNVHVPFSINRVFYSYDIPGGESRGAGDGHGRLRLSRECGQQAEGEEDVTAQMIHGRLVFRQFV